MRTCYKINDNRSDSYNIIEAKSLFFFVINRNKKQCVSCGRSLWDMLNNQNNCFFLWAMRVFSMWFHRRSMRFCAIMLKYDRDYCEMHTYRIHCIALNKMVHLHKIKVQLNLECLTTSLNALIDNAPTKKKIR